MNAVRLMPAVASDSALVAATVAGDRAAFTALYQRHADRVFALATRILGPVDVRHDVLQETFLQLHRALPQFRGEAQFSTFLYRIAVRIATHHGKRFTKAWRRMDPQEVDACISLDSSALDRARARQELEQAFEALGTLTEERRVAFVLVGVEGLSYDEASDVLGISADAVKQRVLRARADLQDHRERCERMRRKEVIQ